MPERFLTLVVAICLVLLASGRAEAAPVVYATRSFKSKPLPNTVRASVDFSRLSARSSPNSWPSSMAKAIARAVAALGRIPTEVTALSAR